MSADTPAWKGTRPKKSSLPLKADGACPSVPCASRGYAALALWVLRADCFSSHAGTPNYRSIDGLPQSKLLTALFRKLLVKEVGGKDADSRPWTEFEAIMTPLR